MKAATQQGREFPSTVTISIHAAREGGDVNVSVCKVFAEISIHAAREGGDFSTSAFISSVRISIHAAREGGDPFTTYTGCGISIFQSTPPVKAATPFARSSPPPTAFQSTPPVKAATLMLA